MKISNRYFKKATWNCKPVLCDWTCVRVEG